MERVHVEQSIAPLGLTLNCEENASHNVDWIHLNNVYVLMMSYSSFTRGNKDSSAVCCENHVIYFI